MRKATDNSVCFKWLRALCVLRGFLVVFPVLSGNGAAASAPPKPPQIERITDKVYRVGKALVDLEARTVTVPGIINMDSGSIEYLAVAPGGKTHESLLRIEARPLHIQVALLLLGLEPKNVLAQQGDRRTPQGDGVEIRVRWRDKTGAEKEVRAEDWVSEMPKARPMPTHLWAFTGSRIMPEGFEADLSKSLVAVWHDPAAILDNPLPGGANNAYVVNTKRVPRRGTTLSVVFRAPKAAIRTETKPAPESIKGK